MEKDKSRMFSLLQSFYIDNNELDGIRLQEIFVLGVEFEMVMNLIKENKEFSRPIHTNNSERIMRLLLDQGRVGQISPYENFEDENNTWMELTVYDTLYR